MVTKSKKQAVVEKEQKKSRVKVGTLKLNKETVKDLNRTERKQIKGGQISNTCDCPATGGCYRTGYCPAM